MNLIRKFFNTDAPEVASSGGGQSIAELMARHGVINESENPVATPISIQETKEETNPAQEPTPAATATETQNDGQAKAENPSPATVDQTPITPQKEETAQVQQTWQEVLKSQQPDAVLKELGYDEKVVSFIKEIKEIDPKMVGLLNTWKTNGDLKSYLRELTTDYKSMSAEDVMRHQLRREYPNASEAALGVLFKKEVIKAYSLDSEDESELEEGRLLLEAKSDRYRNELIQNQDNFLIPPAPEPKQSESESQLLAQQQEQQRQFEAYKSQITDHSYTKLVIAAKALPIGEGDDKFNFPIQDPSTLTKVLFDDTAWANGLFTKEGDKYLPDVEKQLFLAAAHQDYKGLIREMEKHFKSLGGKAAIEPIDNAKPTGQQSQSSAAVPEYKSPAEAMAKQGKLNTGGI